MTSVAPLTATITSTLPITWSNGIPFTGYLVVGCALPTNAQGVQYARINLYGVQPAQELPKWTVIPITQGVFNPSAGLFYSNNIEPPQTLYALYYFDSTGQLIYPPLGIPPTLVSVETNPYVVPAPTLTIPTAPTAVPAPQTTFSTPNSGSQPNYITGFPETPVGVVDGVNTVFTLSRAPLLAIVIKNGLIQDTTSYARVGVTITFTVAPSIGSILEAYLF